MQRVTEPEKTFHLGEERPAQRVEETSIRFEGDFDASPKGVALRHAFFQSWRLESKLPLWVRQMDGGSGRKYRYFANHLIEQLSGARYLEIGSYKGSTLSSVAWGNHLQATCIDHWQQFGGRSEFDENVQRLCRETGGLSLTVIERDFRQVAYGNIGKFDVFCFDGPHDDADHYDGLVMALPALDDEFVLIIDDWVMPTVQTGTKRALDDAGIDIMASITIETTQDNTQPTLLGSWFSDWHNGYLLAAARKR